MRIQHNISALNSHRQLGTNQSNSAKNLEKLSSGYRINRAGDDAAGLAISEKMRAQIRGLDMASKNAQDGVSLIQTAEGALNETHSILQRMRELAVQSSNGIYDDTVDRDNLDKEVEALKDELDRISTATDFNGIKLLDGTQAKAYNAASDAVLQDTSDVVNQIINQNKTDLDFVVEGITTTPNIPVPSASAPATSGSLEFSLTTALNTGEKITVAGKNYTLGTTTGFSGSTAADQMDQLVTLLNNDIGTTHSVEAIKDGNSATTGIKITTKNTGAASTAPGGPTITGTAGSLSIASKVDGVTATKTNGTDGKATVSIDVSGLSGSFVASDTVTVNGQTFTLNTGGSDSGLAIDLNNVANTDALMTTIASRLTNDASGKQVAGAAGAWSYDGTTKTLNWKDDNVADHSGAIAGASVSLSYSSAGVTGNASTTATEGAATSTKATIEYDFSGASGNFADGESITINGETFTIVAADDEDLGNKKIGVDTLDNVMTKIKDQLATTIDMEGGSWNYSGQKLTWSSDATNVKVPASGGDAVSYTPATVTVGVADNIVSENGTDAVISGQKASQTVDLTKAFEVGERFTIGGKTFVFTSDGTAATAPEDVLTGPGGAFKPDHIGINLGVLTTKEEQANAIREALDKAAAAGGINEDYTIGGSDAQITITAKNAGTQYTLADPIGLTSDGKIMANPADYNGGRFNVIENLVGTDANAGVTPQNATISYALDASKLKVGDTVSFGADNTAGTDGTAGGAATERVTYTLYDSSNKAEYDALTEAQKKDAILVDGSVNDSEKVADAIAKKLNNDERTGYRDVEVNGNSLKITARTTEIKPDALKSAINLKFESGGQSTRLDPSVSNGQKAKLSFSISGAFEFGDALTVAGKEFKFDDGTNGIDISKFDTADKQAAEIARLLKQDTNISAKYDIQSSDDKIVIEAKSEDSTLTLNAPEVKRAIEGTTVHTQATITVDENILGKTPEAADTPVNAAAALTFDTTHITSGSKITIGSQSFTVYSTQEEIDALNDTDKANALLVDGLGTKGNGDKLATALAEALNKDVDMVNKFEIKAIGDKLTFKALDSTVDKAAITAATASTVTTPEAQKGNAGIVFQIGANGKEDQRVALHVDDMGSEGLGVASISIGKQDLANDAINDAINKVSSTRADLGALQNRLEHTINNLNVNSENLTAAESRIRDVDMAKEMMEFTKNNILNQAAQAMLAQANQQPQGVL